MKNIDNFDNLELLLIKTKRNKTTIQNKKSGKITKIYNSSRKNSYTEQKYYKNIKKRYNMEPAEYNNLLLKQNNKCAICEKDQSEFKERLCVDHDHNNGKIRGLLCKSCNISIGRLKENILTLEKAIEYLKRSKIDIFSTN